MNSERRTRNKNAQNTNLDKVKLYIKIAIAVLVIISLYTIYLIGKESKLKYKEFTSPELKEPSRIDILFETNDFIVIKKIRRYDQYFTQGLFLDRNVGDSSDTLIESSGLYGESTLQKYRVDSPDQKIFKIPLNSTYFGEGVCKFGNKLYQLTWQERKVFVYNYESEKLDETPTVLDLPREIKYGWGITNTDKELIITDGTENLYFVNPDVNDFKVIRTLQVKNKKTNRTYRLLNELEYVYGYVFANVFMSDIILVINPEDGSAVKIIDFGVLTNFEKAIKSENAKKIDVLNGIAYDKVNDR